MLTCSGIISEAAEGEARSLCACLQGYLGCASAPHSLGKTINLVHESDIVEATCACLKTPRRGTRLNVAGGCITLRELLRHCDVGSQGVDAHAGDDDLSSKTVLSHRLLDEVVQ